MKLGYFLCALCATLFCTPQCDGKEAIVEKISEEISFKCALAISTALKYHEKFPYTDKKIELGKAICIAENSKFRIMFWPKEAFVRQGAAEYLVSFNGRKVIRKNPLR